MIERWVGESSHIWLAIAAESDSVAQVFQAMISPALYHVIPVADRMLKTVRPSGWVWLK